MSCTVIYIMIHICFVSSLGFLACWNLNKLFSMFQCYLSSMSLKGDINESTYISTNAERRLHVMISVIAFVNDRVLRAVLLANGKESTSRQRSGKGAIRKRLPLQKPRWEKNKLTIRCLYHENIS